MLCSWAAQLHAPAPRLEVVRGREPPTIVHQPRGAAIDFDEVSGTHVPEFRPLFAGRRLSFKVTKLREIDLSTFHESTVYVTKEQQELYAYGL